MNVAFFITPKSDIVTLNDQMTVRQAMEKMSYHKYSAVPVLDSNGKYQFTLSEGDILWHLKEHNAMSFKDTENQSILDVYRHRNLEAVSINANIDSLIDCVTNQSFVPVVDDHGIFIGIIKRSDIINYLVSRSGLSAENRAEYIASVIA